MTKDEGRIGLLIEAADDCIGYANCLLNDAPNMGATKEQKYRREAAAVEARAKELRDWADELRAAQDEPGCDHVWGTLVSEGATGFTMTHSCEKCGAPGKVIVVPAEERQAEPKSERPDKDDAERYRWMRQHFQYGGFEQHRLEWYLPHRYGNRTPPLAEQLDQAIDEQRNALNRGGSQL